MAHYEVLLLVFFSLSDRFLSSGWSTRRLMLYIYIVY